MKVVHNDCSIENIYEYNTVKQRFAFDETTIPYQHARYYCHSHLSASPLLPSAFLSFIPGLFAPPSVVCPVGRLVVHRAALRTRQSTPSAKEVRLCPQANVLCSHGAIRDRRKDYETHAHRGASSHAMVLEYINYSNSSYFLV